jgi:hypothetical protein
MYLVFLRLRRRVGWPRAAKNWIWKNGQRTMRDAGIGQCLRVVSGALIYTFIWKTELRARLQTELQTEAPRPAEKQGMG